RRHTRWPRDWSSDVCSSDLFRSALGGGFQILDRRFLSRDRHVFRLEGMLDIDPERALRQVAHMTHRRANVVLGTKKPAKRLGLRRGFNDDQWVCHVRLEKSGSPLRSRRLYSRSFPTMSSADSLP